MTCRFGRVGCAGIVSEWMEISSSVGPHHSSLGARRPPPPMTCPSGALAIWPWPPLERLGGPWARWWRGRDRGTNA
jgi:hypothetical protein